MNRKYRALWLSSIMALSVSSVSIAQYTGESISIGLCSKAVSLGRDYIDGASNIAHQRKQASSISDEAYTHELTELSSHSEWLSMDRCMNDDSQSALYQCLVDTSGKVPDCMN